MYVKQSDAVNLLMSEGARLFESMQAKNHLIADLSKGDDWSFVIKTQTLIESAITSAILAKIGKNELSKALQIMPLVGDGVSKLSFSKDLGLTTSAQRRFVTKMASLRNLMAHNPEYGNFTFDSYIQKLDPNQQKAWQLAIPWFADSQESKQTWHQHSLENPKSVIYIAAFMLIGLLELSATEISVLQRIDELSVATTTELLRGMDL
jgi:hypothetical protein